MKTLYKYLFALSAVSLLTACDKEDKPTPPPPFIPEKIISFPGAEGGGAYATGGRGQKVVYVTTLSDGDGVEGSLRDALRGGNCIVLFKVAGTIKLIEPLLIPSNVTIAGQSAPGKGITLRNYPVRIVGNNVIVRFIRSRLGNERTEDGYDAMEAQNRRNVIIDHCSMSWSVDECASFYDNENFTLQYSIITESLRAATHPKGSHGYCGIWGGTNATFHHNLLAHHDNRNPRFNGDRFTAKIDNEKVDFRNNVIYNWGSNSGYAGEGGYYNMVNNYYKPGPSTKSGVKTRIFAPDSNPVNDKGNINETLKESPLWQALRKLTPPKNGLWGKFYINGNYMEGSPDVNTDNWKGVFPQLRTSSTSDNPLQRDLDTRDAGLTSTSVLDIIRKQSEFSFPDAVSITTQSAENAYTTVLNYAGARLERNEFNTRDNVDTRVVSSVKNGTGSLIDTQNDVGGWDEPAGVIQAEHPANWDTDNDGIPNAWEIENKLNPDSSADGKTKTLDPQGKYTNLEMYLNSLVNNLYP
ncbi:MAG: pectate lyase [Prevotellaceae bacterium]|jgi:hypothetical protein|nr:pectate lyase [Prevotellaceae bacterium]